MVVQIPYLWAEATLVVVWLVVRAVVCARRGSIDRRRELRSLLMLANLMFIVRFTMFPFWRVNGQVEPLVFDSAQILPFRLQPYPLYNVLLSYLDLDMLINLFGNVLLFIPTGAILPIVYPKLDSFWKVFRVGFLMSLAIEAAQLLFYLRTTDVDDLILNCLGVAIGYAIYRRLRRQALQHAPSEQCDRSQGPGAHQ